MKIPPFKDKKSHMPIINKICDNYGKINYEYIGLINFHEILSKTPLEKYQKWAKKYHPKRYFYAAIFIETESTECFKLYVCIDDINSDWDSKYWIEKYDLDKNKKYRLPVAMSRKKIEEWKLEFEKLLSQ